MDVCRVLCVDLGNLIGTQFMMGREIPILLRRMERSTFSYHKRQRRNITT